MNANSIHVKRTATILRPDQSRVLLRPFSPGDPQRTGRIIARIMSLPEDRVGPLLDEVSAEFSQRHQQIHKSFLERFEQVRDLLLTDEEISEQRQLLIGSYFFAEYSLESAALFNPSIVPHPDQSDLPPGALRFILSLRATGEGHISSITFRTGIIHADHRIEVLPPTGFLTEPRQIPNPRYEKALFERKLFELGLTSEFTRRVMDKLGESFALEELRANLEAEMKQSAACRNQERRSGEFGCWPGPITRFSFSPNSSCLNASFSRPRRRNATASKTPGSSVSRTMTAPTSTTPPSRPSMARWSCRSWWRPLTSSSFGSSP